MACLHLLVAAIRNLGPNLLMEYRGVRFAIRMGIARGHWQVAVYLPDKESPKETTVVGTRRDAEIAASSNIDAWLKTRLRQHPASGP